MPEGNPTVSGAVSDALSEQDAQVQEFLDGLQQYNEDEASAFAEAAAAAASDPDSSFGGGTEAGDENDEDEEVEAPEGTTSEPPVKYGRLDLSGIPADQREAIIAQLDEQNGVIRSTNEEKAQLRKQLAEEEEARLLEQEQVALSDEELLAKYGYEFDPNDPYAEVEAKVALPLLRQMEAIAAERELEAQDRVLQETLDLWTGELDRLERQFGELPPSVSREDVLAFAAENGIYNPEAAYHMVQAGADAIAQNVLAAAKAAPPAAKTGKPKGIQRPRGTAKSTGKGLTGMSTKDAILAAAAEAEAEAGYTFAEAAGLPR